MSRDEVVAEGTHFGEVDEDFVKVEEEAGFELEGDGI